MDKIAVVISPNWHDYAQKYLRASLASLLLQENKANIKVFLVDNESTDLTLAYIRETAESVLAGHIDYEILASGRNLGFAGGNNIALKKIFGDGFSYVALFNMDGRLAEGCLNEMVRVMRANLDAGAVQARMMLWPDVNLVNSLGNVTHFLGYGYCYGYGQPYRANRLKALDIAYPSGAAVLLRVSALEKVGLFDEEFWMYNEDQDLGWRLWLAGMKTVLAPEAVFYHEYEFGRSVGKFYWIDRNRLLAIFKNYHWLTLLLIMPALLVTELVAPLLAWRGGWLKQKIGVWKYFSKPRTWRYLREARAHSQGLRRVSDRSIVKMFSATIDYQEVDSAITGLANVILNIYWSIARRIIFW